MAVELTQEAADRRAIRREAEARGSQISPLLGIELSGAIKHGGIYELVDPHRLGERLATINAPGFIRGGAPAMATTMSDRVSKYYFYRIVDKPHALHADLVSYLTLPNAHPSVGVGGRMYSEGEVPSQDIPAAMTFVGQFIDHDLTLNSVNLFTDNMDDEPQNDASPYLDLDSVYGPRRDEAMIRTLNARSELAERPVPQLGGFFQLREIPGGGYDVCRKDSGSYLHDADALIGDKRNDENQLILQVHILLMRLHNALLTKLGGKEEQYEEAKKQTILHWQSFVANEYLPLVCDPQIVEEVKRRLNEEPKRLVHRPGRTEAGGDTLGMPHEFAIAFRIGHSQLRASYKLNPTHGFPLFERLTDGAGDLRGGKPLTGDRLIDWPFFHSVQSGQSTVPSNLLDTQVRDVMFDLPEGTIPDIIPLVTNLPFRNLQRSENVMLCSGEDLVKAYRDAGYQVTMLSSAEVEPESQYRRLFMLGDGQSFRTPLWYYVLREAEVFRGAPTSSMRGHLGPLGSLLISEVILSGIWYATPSYMQDASWTSLIPTTAPDGSTGDPRKVRLIDIANFVNSTSVDTPACGN